MAMESSSFSHKEPFHLDFPNAFKALRAAVAYLLAKSAAIRTKKA